MVNYLTTPHIIVNITKVRIIRLKAPLELNYFEQIVVIVVVSGIVTRLTCQSYYQVSSAGFIPNIQRRMIVRPSRYPLQDHCLFKELRCSITVASICLSQGLCALSHQHPSR